MNIQAFIHQVAGDWFAQKTVYDLDGAKNDSSKSNLSIEFLEPGDAAIAPLCQDCQVEQAQVWGALRTQWDTSVDPYRKPHETGQALLVLLKGDDEQSGQFIRSGSTQVGECSLDPEDVLTMTIEQDGMQISDRLWFATENLRFRTSVIEQAGKISHTTFYSEIRRMK